MFYMSIINSVQSLWRSYRTLSPSVKLAYALGSGALLGASVVVGRKWLAARRIVHVPAGDRVDKEAERPLLARVQSLLPRSVDSSSSEPYSWVDLVDLLSSN